MKNLISRRSFLTTTAAISAVGAGTVGAQEEIDKTKNSPLAENRPPIVLHQTDLFHPHGDPDDHFDLATLFALEKLGKIDLAGLILDYPPAHRQGDPAIGALAQMNRLTARAVPAAVGMKRQMKSFDDAMTDLDEIDSAAVRFIIKTLENAPTPVRISCVGSATDLAVASVRRPDLFRKSCAGLYLDAGAAFSNPEKPDLLEFNVRLNPIAYRAMFALSSPLFWFPCWNVVEERESGEWGTFYWLPHRSVFEGISTRLKNFFVYLFERSGNVKWLAALDKEMDEEIWTRILGDRRGMWSTASLLYLAGMAVTKEGELANAEEIAPNDALYRMEPIAVTCDEKGRTEWKRSDQPTGIEMFHVLDPKAYPTAMTRGVNSLLRVF